MNTWGRLDILVNNAGILRDKAFNNMSMEDYEFVNQVHHFGTVYCTKAAWPIMRKQSYGRIVVTTSGSGTVGNFGQANYGAAKMAVNGLINVLRHEGAKYNIRLQRDFSVGLTRMTESLLPPDIAPWMKPELVSPRSPGCAAKNATRTARSLPRPPAATPGCSISSPRACSSIQPNRCRSRWCGIRSARFAICHGEAVFRHDGQRGGEASGYGSNQIADRNGFSEIAIKEDHLCASACICGSISFWQTTVAVATK